jgi:hypothetical protein
MLGHDVVLLLAGAVLGGFVTVILSRPRVMLSIRHDASVCETPHSRHWKVYRSGNPPNRFVLRTSVIRRAQLGQSGGGGVGVELLVSSSNTNINGTRFSSRATWDGCSAATISAESNSSTKVVDQRTLAIAGG